MKSEILFSQREIAAWVFKHLPYSPQSLIDIQKGYYCAVGFMRYGKICGGIVWTKLAKNLSDVEVSYAGHGAWLSPQVARFMTFAPFKVFHVKHVTARIPVSCTKSITLLERHGWKHEGLQRKAYDGKEDLVLMGMIEEDAEEAFKE